MSSCTFIEISDSYDQLFCVQPEDIKFFYPVDKKWTKIIFKDGKEFIASVSYEVFKKALTESNYFIKKIT